MYFSKRSYYIGVLEESCGCLGGCHSSHHHRSKPQWQRLHSASVLPPVDPAYRALCISLCLVLCILRPIVHWPEVTGRVCRPAPMLLKNVYKWSAAAAKSSAVLLPWQKSDLSWGNSLASAVSPVVSSAKGGSRPVATSAFSLFAFCSAFHCLLCHLSTFYISLLALLSTVSTSSTNKWTELHYLPSLCFPHPNNFSEKVNLKYQKSAIKLFRLKMTHHPTPHSLLTNFLKVIRLERGNWI